MTNRFNRNEAKDFGCKVFKKAGLYALSLGWMLAVGCAAPTLVLDESAVGKLRAGMARSEVQAVLGKPKHSERGSNQKTLEVYDNGFAKSDFNHDMVQVSTGQIEARTLSIIYRPDEKVESFRHYISHTRYHEEKPGFFRIGKVIEATDTFQITKGVTKKEEFAYWAGEPTLMSLRVDGNIECRWDYFEIKATQTIKKQFFEVVCNKDEIILDYRFVNR